MSESEKTVLLSVAETIVDGHRERIDVHRCRERRCLRLHRRKSRIAHLRERRRLRDLDRQRRDAIGLVRGDDLRGGEAPRALGDRADAEPERVCSVGALEPPVLHQRVLLVAAHEPNVCVRGAPLPRCVECAFGEIALDREARDHNLIR